MLYNVQPVSGSLVASAVLKAAKGRLHYLHAYNNNGTGRFLMFFDAAAVPSNGATPQFMIPVAANASLAKEVAFPPDGYLAAAGLTIALSTTAATLTIAAADLIFTAGIS